MLDKAKLFAWADSRLPGQGLPLSVSLIKGGSSNLLYRLDRAGQSFALRRPPREKYDPTSHNLAREARLLAVLGGTDVPHPRLIAFCDDPTVIGAPFLIMDYVDGFSPVGQYPEPFNSDPTLRRQVGFAMVETLAKLSSVAWQEAGLQRFGKPEGFLGRQVGRWMSQLARYQTREIPHLAELARWLEDNRPAQSATALMHGDFSFPNVMMAPQPPVRIVAVVDWESCTIGDPLLDFGHLLAGWCDPGESQTYLRGINWRDMPTRREMTAHYAALTGRSVDALPYYRALALFKLAIILEGAYTRFINGQSDYEPHRTLATRVPQFIAQALRFANEP